MMMTPEAVADGLREIFADVFSRDVPGWDSFKQVEILMASEERFGLKFTSSEVDGFRCLGDLMAVVERRGTA